MVPADRKKVSESGRTRHDVRPELGRLVPSAGSRVTPNGTVNAPELAATLHQVDELLRAAQQCCGATAACVAPDVRRGQTLRERYARALANWPGETKPSYEQLGLLLSQLHQLHGAIHAAIREADAAAELIARLRNCYGDGTGVDCDA